MKMPTLDISLLCHQIVHVCLLLCLFPRWHLKSCPLSSLAGPQAGLIAYISGNVYSLSLIVSFTTMVNTKQTGRKYKSKEEEEVARKKMEEEAKKKKTAESKKRKCSKETELEE